MIKVNFDPAKIAGSLLLRVEDLKYPTALAVKLQNGADPLSTYLRTALSAGTQLQLQAIDISQPLPETLRDDLIAELNQLLQGSLIYDKKDFKGTAWSEERETLMKALIRQVQAQIKEDPKKGEGLIYFNRLLIEEFYPDEIALSPRAEWDAWTYLADAAKARVIGEWEDWKLKRKNWKKTRVGDAPMFNPSWDEDVWKGFRDWLKTYVFNNKCAYCETKITGFPGDTEHFRPKGRVRVVLEDESSEIVKIVDEEGEVIPHPGYFWLAYHWQNLLPSCIFCNSSGGKSDLFPVEKEKPHIGVKRLTVEEIDILIDRMTQSPNAADIFYLEPRDLDKFEGRLLIHPYFDKPEDHIHFEIDGTAAVWNESKKGHESIKVYHLNEKSKLAARSDEQHNARKSYFSVMAVTDDDVAELTNAAQKFMDEYFQGRKPYAAAVFDFIHFKLSDSPYDPATLLGERHQKI